MGWCCCLGLILALNYQPNRDVSKSTELRYLEQERSHPSVQGICPTRLILHSSLLFLPVYTTPRTKNHYCCIQPYVQKRHIEYTARFRSSRKPNNWSHLSKRAFHNRRSRNWRCHPLSHRHSRRRSRYCNGYSTHCSLDSMSFLSSLRSPICLNCRRCHTNNPGPNYRSH